MLTQPFDLSFRRTSAEVPPASTFGIESPIELGYPIDTERTGGVSRSKWEYNRPGEHLHDPEYTY